MASIRQSWSIVRRYYITIYRSPIRSLIRTLLWPGGLLAVILYYLITIQNNMDNIKEFNLESYIGIFSLLLTGFLLWYHTEHLVKDKATGMKSLMISMGLRRTSYHLGNFISFIIPIIPIILTLTIIALKFILIDSKSPVISTILIFLLFIVQLNDIAFIMTSLIKTTKLLVILVVYLSLQGAYHTLILELMSKVSNSYYSLILFLASSSPYEPIKIFCDSYTICKNDCPGIDFQKDKVSQQTYIIMLTQIAWIIILHCFARWFEEVCPWQDDTAVKGPLFCLKKDKTQKGTIFMDLDTALDNKYFEQRDNRELEIGIQIRNIGKSYKGVMAVDNLSFNIYKGETTLLLGHNGAGKTTLMNIILGRLEQDRGQVVLKKSDSKSIGVCPQNSIFDENLNVKQHLELFVDIKSIELSGREREMHIKQTIEDVSLSGHINKLPPELSGGMQRKLSLAMAFVGKSDILILDEPSSGLDPDSRVFIWNAIRRYRMDRTVLLSTQHMEEADYLGDRIAIMAEGKIICCGSSIFLTEALGNCYKLRVKCGKSKRKNVLAITKKYFLSARLANNSLIDDSAQEIVIELMDDKSKDLEQRLIHLLEYIEGNPSSVHGIESYGLKSSSIEDVMLNTSKVLTDTLNTDSSNTRVNLRSPSTSHIELLSKQLHESDTNFLKTQKTILYALLVKQMQTYKRDWKILILYRIILPIASLYYYIQSYTSDVSFIPSYQPKLLNMLMIVHYIYYPTDEKVSKFKTMQLTSFASPVLYWISHLLSDLFSVILLCIFATILNILLLDDIYLVSQVQLYSVLNISLLLFGISAAFLSYVLSTLFRDSKTCIEYLLLMYSISTFFNLFLLIIQAVINTDIFWLTKTTHYFFIILYPTDAIQYVAYGFVEECYVRRISSPCKDVESISPVLFGIGILCCQIFVYCGVLYIIERSKFDLSWYCRWRNFGSCFRKMPVSSGELREMDQDVIDESVKALDANNGDLNQSYSLVATNLNKSYTYGVRIINDLSFTVNKGECFGLLGVNGAGKSTTFSMLSAEIKPDSGKIWVEGSSDFKTYREKLGYDPQSSPNTLLTSREALYLMARLRRVNEHSITMLVNAILELLQMEEHSEKTVKQLSGGTKRKLSLGMSLIGNPALLALDEPTAGVDPLARVDIWSLLRSLRSHNKSAIVISSHAMEECEAVCDRIAIMARGRLRCIGTFLHLRSKFSQGGRLRVQFGKLANDGITANNINMDAHQFAKNLEGQLSKNISSSISLVDFNLSGATFSIPDNSVRRSAIFKTMRELRKKHPEIHYTLNDASLEDIFIALAKEEQESDKNPR